MQILNNSTIFLELYIKITFCRAKKMPVGFANKKFGPQVLAIDCIAIIANMQPTKENVKHENLTIPQAFFKNTFIIILSSSS